MEVTPLRAYARGLRDGAAALDATALASDTIRLEALLHVALGDDAPGILDEARHRAALATGCACGGPGCWETRALAARLALVLLRRAVARRSRGSVRPSAIDR